jgi:hypothetical protein
MVPAALSAAAVELGPPYDDASLIAAVSEDSAGTLCRAAGISARRQDTLRSDAPLARCVGGDDPLSWPFVGVLMGLSDPAGDSEEFPCCVRSACRTRAGYAVSDTMGPVHARIQSGRGGAAAA